MQGRLIAIAAIILFVMAGVGTVQQGYRASALDSGERVGLTENVTVNHGQVTTLSESNRTDIVYNRSDTITVEQNGQTFRSEGNWTWLEGNGTLSVDGNSGLTDGGFANVTYGYAIPSNEQVLGENIGLLFTKTLGDEWVFIAGILLLLAAVAIFSRSGY